MKMLIVGEGRLVFFVGRAFTAKGHQTVIIDRDGEECVRLARQMKATVVNGDGADPEVLREAGAIGAEAVLALTPRDQDNLVICQIATHEFGVPRTLALADDPDNVRVFDTLGVPAFSTTDIVSSLIEQRAALDQVTRLLPVGAGRVIVTELVLDGESPVVGRPLREIALPRDALIAVVIRDDAAMVPGGATRLLPRDRIVVITLPDNHGPVLRALTGESQ